MYCLIVICLLLVTSITLVDRSAFYQLRNISKISRLLDSECLQTVVHSLVTNRLYLNNSLYVGLPQQQLNKLRRVHHAAARLITGQKKHESISPILHALHWLPIERGIDYKILVSIYKCLNDIAPVYLSELSQFHSHGRTLRSSSELTLVEPFSFTNLL